MKKPNDVAAPLTAVAIGAAAGNLQVFGVFFFKDVQCIIDRDDAKQALVIRDNRHGEQVVFGDVTRNVFLVVFGRRGNEVLIGNLFEFLGLVGDDKLIQGNNA